MDAFKRVYNRRETGFIVPFDNPQDLFNERILSLYNNRSLLMQMKKESRARAFCIRKRRPGLS